MYVLPLAHFLLKYHCYLLVYLVHPLRLLAPPVSFSPSKDLYKSKPVADVCSHEFHLLVTKGKQRGQANSATPSFFFRRQNNFRGPLKRRIPTWSKEFLLRRLIKFSTRNFAIQALVNFLLLISKFH